MLKENQYMQSERSPFHRKSSESDKTPEKHYQEVSQHLLEHPIHDRVNEISEFSHKKGSLLFIDDQNEKQMIFIQQNDSMRYPDELPQLLLHQKTNTRSETINLQEHFKQVPQKEKEGLTWEEMLDDPEKIFFENPFKNLNSIPSITFSEVKGKKNIQQYNEQNDEFFEEQQQTQKKICNICLQDCDYFYHELSCKHFYHISCLQKLIQVNIEEKKLPISCPEEQCLRYFSEDDVRTLVSEELFAAYLETSLKCHLQRNSHLYFFCPTPDCQSYQEKSALTSRYFQCLSCEQDYCTSCGKQWHFGPCLDDEHDEQFIKLVRKKLFKNCPQCKKIVERTSGCHHIVCICKFQFCYLCEKQYKKQCKCKYMYFTERQHLFNLQKKSQDQMLKEEKQPRKRVKKDYL